MASSPPYLREIKDLGIDGRPLPESLREVVREIDRRLIQETDYAQGVRLMTAAFILTGLRVPRETWSSIYDGVRIMHETTAYDFYVEEGKIAQNLRILLKLGRKQFGDPDPQTESALTAIRDLDRLERMAEAVLSVQSWQELLATR